MTDGESPGISVPAPRPRRLPAMDKSASLPLLNNRGVNEDNHAQDSPIVRHSEELESFRWPGLPPPKKAVSKSAFERSQLNNSSSSSELPPAYSQDKDRFDRIFKDTNGSGLWLPPPTTKASTHLRSPAIPRKVMQETGFSWSAAASAARIAAGSLDHGEEDDFETWKRKERERKEELRRQKEEAERQRRRAQFAKRDEDRRRVEAEFKIWQREELRRAQDGRKHGWDYRTDAQAWQSYEAKAADFFETLSCTSCEGRLLRLEDVPFPPCLGEGLVRHLCNQEGKPSTSVIKQAYQQAIRFWHPDKFQARYLDLFAVDQRNQLMDLVKQVSQTINREYATMTKGA